MKVDYIVWHTAAHGKNGVVYDTTAEQINSWHKDRGWDSIGYHFVIRLNGTVEKGRPTDKEGAHVKGLNHRSIGICFSGHGDIAPLTSAQWSAGLQLTAKLIRDFDLKPSALIGHREVNNLIDCGLLSHQYRVSKSCPGRLVDMVKARTDLKELLDRMSLEHSGTKIKYDQNQAKKLFASLRSLYEVINELQIESAKDELNAFRKVKEVDDIIAWYKSNVESGHI